MQENFELAMFGRVPLPQSLDMLLRGARHDITTLHGKKAPAHGWPGHRFHVALRQLINVDLVKDGKTGQLRNGVRRGDCPC